MYRYTNEAVAEFYGDGDHETCGVPIDAATISVGDGDHETCGVPIDSTIAHPYPSTNSTAAQRLFAIQSACDTGNNPVKANREENPPGFSS